MQQGRLDRLPLTLVSPVISLHRFASPRYAPLCIAPISPIINLVLFVSGATDRRGSHHSETANADCLKPRCTPCASESSDLGAGWGPHVIKRRVQRTRNIAAAASTGSGHAPAVIIRGWPDHRLQLLRTARCINFDNDVTDLRRERIQQVAAT
jgi:hypothetical protein